MLMIIPVFVLAVVFILIAVRQVGRFKLQIWHIMLGGALAVLVTRQISLTTALKSINVDVMLFLFGMFVVGEALEASGYLSHLSFRIFRRARSADALILSILFVIGVASAFLMNDTLAIIGTPVVLLLAKKHKIGGKVLLLTLAFAVTIGSVMSPIGNPQNLLIAINGNIANPFVTFLKYLLIPTLINLFLCYLLLKFFYREHFHSASLIHEQEPIKDKRLAIISRISMIIILALIFAKILLVFLKVNIDFRLTYIALIAAAPVLIFSNKRAAILKGIDWHTLVFFAAMFVLMASVWNTGYFQKALLGLKVDVASIAVIFLVGILASQLISNVPLVALYLPLLLHAGAGIKEMVALAASSTIAGNLFILGAASNIIIIQNAEKRTGETLTFLDFARIGVPLTIINVVVYWFFLSL